MSLDAASLGVPTAGAVPRDAMTPVVTEVLRAIPEIADTSTLILARPPGFTYRPGQFTMLYAFGVGEAAISISGDPEDEAHLVQTIRAVGATSRALVSLTPGAAIGVRGPYGTGWPVEACRGRDVVVVAGGLGLAPLRPVIAHIRRRRDTIGKVTLVVGARSPDLLLYRDELAVWGRWGDMIVIPTVDSAGPTWGGAIGLVTDRLNGVARNPGQTVAYLCGPEVMMRFTADALNRMGVPGDRIWLSLERNMKCAIGHCGHCQYGPAFLCKEGPVFSYAACSRWLTVREV